MYELIIFTSMTQHTLTLIHAIFRGLESWGGGGANCCPPPPVNCSATKWPDWRWKFGYSRTSQVEYGKIYLKNWTFILKGWLKIKFLKYAKTWQFWGKHWDYHHNQIWWNECDSLGLSAKNTFTMMYTHDPWSMGNITNYSKIKSFVFNGLKNAHHSPGKKFWIIEK